MLQAGRDRCSSTNEPGWTISYYDDKIEKGDSSFKYSVNDCYWTKGKTSQGSTIQRTSSTVPSGVDLETWVRDFCEKRNLLWFKIGELTRRDNWAYGIGTC